MYSFHRMGLTALTLVAGVSAFAQTATTGGISGTILDRGGKPVSGAVVRIASGQVARTVTTGNDGVYRIPQLNPGAYAVSVTKAGFQQYNTRIEVSLNEMRTFNARMAEVESTTVEVVASAAAIDTTSTTQATTTNAERLAVLPTTGRDFNSVIALAPGVQSTANGFLISGSSSIENSFHVDGLETTDMRLGTQGATLPKEFIEQVEVQTGSFKAEYSALGGVVIAATKSGTNEFKGSTWFDWDPRGLMPKPKVEGYVAEDPYKDNKFVGGMVSGPIVKDKLFYFVGVQAQKEASPEAFKSNQAYDLWDSKYTNDMTKVYAKLNWFITTEQQLAFSIQKTNTEYGQENLHNNGANWVSKANWGYKTKDNNANWTLNYDWTISSNLMLSAKIGHTFYDSAVVPTVDTPLVRDRIFYNAGPGKDLGHKGFSYFTGGLGYYDNINNSTKDDIRADLTWFHGNHAVKAGFSRQETKFEKASRQTGGYTLTINSVGAPTYNLYYIEKNQSYYDLTTIKGHYGAFYVQDQWEVSNGLKLSYGVRYETQQIDDPMGNAFFKFTDFAKHLQPRLSVIWDPAGDGASKITAGIARYFQKVPMQTPMRQGGGEKNFSTYWEAPGEATYNMLTGAYTLIGPGYTEDNTVGFTSTPRVDGLKLPERWEYTLGYEKDLGKGLVVKVNGRFREMKNVFEDTVLTDVWGRPADPLSATSPKSPAKGTAIFWNPGVSSVSYLRDGKTITIGSEYTSLFPKPVSRYAGIDFVVNKQTEDYFLDMSYTWSHAYGNYEGIASESNSQQDANGTEAYDFYQLVASGNLPHDRRHQVKLQGGYTFKVVGNPLNASMSWTYMSGNPRSLKDDGSTTNGYAPGWDSIHQVMTPDGKLWAVNTEDAFKNKLNYNAAGYWTGGEALLHRTYAFMQNYGYGGGNVFQRQQFGTGGMNPILSRIDVHLDYTWKFGKKVRLKPSIDIRNLLNRRVVSTWNNTMGDKNGLADAFGAPNSFFEGRTYKFGIHLDF